MVAKRYSPADAPEVVKSYPPNIRKSERLSKHRDVISCLRNRQLIREKCGPVVVNIVPSKQWGLAILFRRKIETAVARNRIKRKIRELYRLSKPQFSSPKTVIFTIYGQPAEKDLSCAKKTLLSTQK